jgi:hypothetical protein
MIRYSDSGHSTNQSNRKSQMKTLISIIALTCFLLISGCYSDSTKDDDSGSVEQGTTTTPRPASNRY